MLEWSEFARRLGRELAGLERDTILIVREREESRHYVQAMRESDRLYAEAVSNNFLEGPLLLTLADEEIMSDAGWRPPADPAPRNWWTELPAHADVDEHGRLADVMVTALRDVQGVRRPSDLVYESFHRHGTGLIELLDFGIEAADPSRVSKQRRTSVELAARARRAKAAGQGAAGLEPAAAAPLAAPVSGPGSGAGPGSGPVPGPGVERHVPDAPDELEPRLAEAKERGDHTTYFDLLLSADLVLPANGPAGEDPEAPEFPTTTIGTGTYVVVFTSPQALARSGQRPVLYRRTSFARLASAWPDPAWQLAINPGLGSEVHLDAAAVMRLDATQRALAQQQGRPFDQRQGQQAAPPQGTPQQAAPPPGAPSAPLAPAQQQPAAPAAGPAPAPPVSPAPDAPTVPPSTPPSAAPPAATPPASAPGASAPPPVASAPPAAPASGAPAPASAPPPGPVPPASAPPVSGPQPQAQAPQQPGPGPGPVSPPPAPQPAPAQPPGIPQIFSGVPLRPPPGTRLWRWDGEGDETEAAVPVAVFDAVTGAWTPVRADALPTPRGD